MKSSAVSSLRWLPLLALLLPGMADAFIVDIQSGTRAVYLRVGDGNFNGTYRNNGTPVGGTSGARNIVTVAVPGAAVGNGVAQQFSATSRVSSDWDAYNFCDAGESYIGGFYRAPGNGGGNASLSATVTAPLSNGTQTIPFTQISWTAAGNGDTGAQPIPGGTFSTGTTALATFPVNTWRESCHTFTYANANVVAAGDYQGTVTYTLSAP